MIELKQSKRGNPWVYQIRWSSQHVLLDIDRSIEIVQDTDGLVEDTGRVFSFPKVSGTACPFRDFLYIPEEPYIQTTG